MESDEMSNISLMIADCDHQIKKLIKLHERLASKNQQLSLHGAAKLLKTYENVLQCSQGLHSGESQLLELIENSRPSEPAVEEEQILNSENSIQTSNEPETILNPPQSDRYSRKEIVGDDSDFIEEVMIESGPEVDANECLFSPESENFVEVESRGSDESPRKRTKTDDAASGEIEAPTLADNTLSDLTSGTELSAFCKINGEKKPGEWILARYLRQVDTDLYEVEDAEDSQPEESVKRSKKSARIKYTVSSNQLILLDRKKTGKVRSRDRIYALFPGTTCFYPATVLNLSQKRKKDEITVRFADDSAPSRNVPFKYIFRYDAVNLK